MILLDTHVAIWLVASPARLSTAARETIAGALSGDQANPGLAIASITLWETALLLERGQVVLRGAGGTEAAVSKIVKEAGLQVLPLTVRAAALAVALPRAFPRDPADRLIAGTALAEGLQLVTSDKPIRQSGTVDAIW